MVSLRTVPDEFLLRVFLVAVISTVVTDDLYEYEERECVLTELL